MSRSVAYALLIWFAAATPAGAQPSQSSCRVIFTSHGGGDPCEEPDGGTCNNRQIVLDMIRRDLNDSTLCTVSVSSASGWLSMSLGSQSGGPFPPGIYTHRIYIEASLTMGANPSTESRTGFLDFTTSGFEVNDRGRVGFSQRGQPAAAPDARDDRYGVVSGQAITIPSPGVLANDLNGPLRATIISPPDHGRLDLQQEGGFTFTPGVGGGSTAFTYRATARDGRSDFALVHLDLRPRCGNVGPIKLWHELGGTLNEQRQAERLEEIAGMTQAEREAALLAEGYITSPNVNAQLVTAVNDYRAFLAQRSGLILPIESGYRPVPYQAHFWDLRQIRIALYEYVYPRGILNTTRRAECDALIRAVTADARTRHGIAQRGDRPEGFQTLSVSDPAIEGNATHPAGQGMDLGGIGNRGVDVEAALHFFNLGRTVKLGRPFALSSEDYPHFGLLSGADANNSIRVRLNSPEAAGALAYIRPQTALAALLLTDPIGRRFGTTAAGQFVNEIGGGAIAVGGDSPELYVAEAIPGSYSVQMHGTGTGSALLEIIPHGQIDRSVAVASSLVAGATASAIPFTLGAAPVDSSGPVVEPPPSMTIVAPTPSGVLVSASPQLQAYLAGGTATDNFDPAPASYQQRLGNVVLEPSTLVPVGDHVITFAFSDGSGNVGTGESRLRVVRLATGAPEVPTFTASAVGTRVTVAWTASSQGAVLSYRLLVGSQPGGADVAAIDMGLLTGGVGELPVGTYYLRVEARNSIGVTTSEELRLKVGGPPPPKPDFSASVNGRSVQVTWALPTSESNATYTLNAGTRPGASDIATLQMGALTSLTADLPSGTYYVRIAASTLGGTSVSREIALRATCDVPSVPSLSVTKAGGVVALSWPPVAGALNYRLQAGSAPGLSNLVDGDVGTVLSVSAAPPAGTYFVRLLATNQCGASQATQDVTVVVP